MEPAASNAHTQPDPNKRSVATRIYILYWFIPLTVVVMSIVGAVYALTAPSVPITDPAVKQFIPVVTDKMLQHARVVIAASFGWAIFSVVFLGLFIQLGWAVKLQEFVRKRSSNLLVQVALFTLIFTTIANVVDAPLEYLTGFWMPHYYGLSSQPLLEWLGDLGKGFAVGVVVQSLLWFIFFFLVMRFPKKWPTIFFAVSIPLTLFMVFIDPLVIDPIFNKIEPMAVSPLREKIGVLAAKSGIPDAPILVSDKSKQTNRINAYVTGIGGSARIVIWDTTIAKLPAEQVLCIVAHELGHYKLNHVPWGCALAIALNFLTVPINFYITPRFFRNCPKSWGIRSVSDIAAIPVIMLIALCGNFWAEPIANSYCRSIEHDADMYGVHINKDPINAAKAFARLAQENLSEPNPPKLLEVWLYSHPPLAKRVRSTIEFNNVDHPLQERSL